MGPISLQGPFKTYKNACIQSPCKLGLWIHWHSLLKWLHWSSYVVSVEVFVFYRFLPRPNFFSSGWLVQHCLTLPSSSVPPLPFFWGGGGVGGWRGDLKLLLSMAQQASPWNDITRPCNRKDALGTTHKGTGPKWLLWGMHRLPGPI